MNNLWLLGIVTFLFFGGATLGNILGSRIMTLKILSEVHLLIISRLIMAITLVGLSLSNNILSFIVMISLCYLFLGVSNIPEGVILNNLTPSSKRASMLSFTSLIFQFGGLAGSLLSSIVITFYEIPLIWILSSVFIFLTVIQIYRVINNNSSVSNIDEM